MMWLNGKLVESGLTEASGAGNLLGWGVFTTLGVRAGKPRFLRRHFERLKRDAGETELDFDLDFAAIERAVAAVLGADSLQNGLMRLTLTARGDGRWSARSGADFSVLALETSLSPATLRVQISPYRVEAKRPLCGVKTTAYLPYFWAWRDAKKRGFDEAILCDGAGFLSEGARATLFWTRADEVFTPSLETGCLRGIGRDLLLQWAAQSGSKLRVGRFEAREIEGAAQWLVSAASGPRRVTSWHDENGEISGESGAPDALGSDFERWFRAQTE